MKKKIFAILAIVTTFSIAVANLVYNINHPEALSKEPEEEINEEVDEENSGEDEQDKETDYINIPFSIKAMRTKEYPGSEVKIEKELAQGTNFKQYIASYKSDGLKLYALLLVPTTKMPEGGYPVIIFNHGYIPPEEYRTNEKYVAYQERFAKNGYVVFKSDYRGHGNSEGIPEGAYFSPAYTTDVLNALDSVKTLKYVNPEKIGMWGHSLGGHITLKSMVISKEIKAGVIWAGVVASHQEMYENWMKNSTWRPSQREVDTRRMTRQKFIETYKTPDENPQVWKEISANSYLEDLSGPIQLHHGTADVTVPYAFSETLAKTLTELKKENEFFTYTGADHNLSGAAFGPAITRSVAFFDKYLKN